MLGARSKPSWSSKSASSSSNSASNFYMFASMASNSTFLESTWAWLTSDSLISSYASSLNSSSFSLNNFSFYSISSMIDKYVEFFSTWYYAWGTGNYLVSSSASLLLFCGAVGSIFRALSFSNICYSRSSALRINSSSIAFNLSSSISEIYITLVSSSLAYADSAESYKMVLVFFHDSRSLRKSSISRMNDLLSVVTWLACMIYSSRAAFSRTKFSSSYSLVMKFI